MISKFSRAAPYLIPTLVLLTPLAVRAESLDQRGTLWSPVLEWTLEDSSFDEESSTINPFDVEARVTFVHEESGEERRTGMYYAGEGKWKFRFTGTRTGLWKFESRSERSHLNGKQGKVEIAPSQLPSASGFIVAERSRFARQVGKRGELEGFVPNIYMDYRKYGHPSDCGWTDVSRTFGDAEVLTNYLDEAERHGCNGIQALIGNQWFRADAPSSRDHDSENPDPKTFAALEQAIQAAHRRRMHLHIWAWGDEQRRWTPVRVGGVNGPADRRIQRYLAARLGPLPGWTMSYGFDLDEWVTSEEVNDWQEHLQQQMGWPHLLGARAAGRFAPPTTLDILAHDARPRDRFYDSATELLDRANGRPVLLERRFSYLRDDIWDMDTTRRAFWQLTLAGGVGAIWGHYPPNCAAYVEGNYPHPEQMRTHRTFWKHRFRLDMYPDLESVPPPTRVFTNGDDRLIVYREESTRIRLPLSQLESAQRSVAVDTRKPYEEIDLGLLSSEDQTWQAPHVSDWVIAVGDFSSLDAEIQARNETETEYEYEKDAP
jgi:hypothetical protein